MSETQIVEQLAREWAEFKFVNTQRWAEIEKKGAADPLFEAKLDRLNGAIDKSEDALREIGRSMLSLDRLNGAIDKSEDALREIGRSMLSLDERMAGIETRHESRDGLTAEAREHKAAFDVYAKTGNDRVFSELQAKGMRVRDDENGGYLVPEAQAGAIVSRIFELSPIRSIANVIQTNAIAVEGVVDYGDLQAEWLDESTDASDSTTPTLKKYRIATSTLRTAPQITEQLLQDASTDLEAWLTGKIADRFARAEGTAFVSGTGVGQPRGFATYATVATADDTRAWGSFQHVLSGTNGSFGASPNGENKLIDVVASLKTAYLMDAAWVMNRLTLAAVRKIRNASGASAETGTSLWEPSLAAGQPGRLLGYPVVVAEAMPTFSTTSALAIAFGNFREAYTIADRTGISILRNPYKNPPNVIFHAGKRVGGDVVNFEAIKFLKMAS